MGNARAAEVLDQILADLKELNKGPNDSMSVKALWVRATRRGVTNVQDVTNALQLGVDQELLTFTEGGASGMGAIALTEAGYEKSRT